MCMYILEKCTVFVIVHSFVIVHTFQPSETDDTPYAYVVTQFYKSNTGIYNTNDYIIIVERVWYHSFTQVYINRNTYTHLNVANKASALVIVCYNYKCQSLLLSTHSLNPC